MTLSLPTLAALDRIEHSIPTAHAMSGPMRALHADARLIAQAPREAAQAQVPPLRVQLITVGSVWRPKRFRDAASNVFVVHVGDVFVDVASVHKGRSFYTLRDFRERFFLVHSGEARV